MVSYTIWSANARKKKAVINLYIQKVDRLIDWGKLIFKLHYSATLLENITEEILKV